MKKKVKGLPAGGAAAVAAPARSRWARLTALGVMAALVLTLLAGLFGNTAFAAECEDDEECAAQSYSLYNLSSNVGAFFDNSNSPEGTKFEEDGGFYDKWRDSVAHNTAAGGSLLGYVDPDFSWSLEWAISKVSNASISQSYKSLTNVVIDVDDNSRTDSDAYKGALEYAYFGAANTDLGLANMKSGMDMMPNMFETLGAGMMLMAYLGTVGVGIAFMLVIKLLQLLNPFMWFEEAVRNQWGDTFSLGMTQGETVNPVFSSISKFIDSWYTILQDLSWQVLVPLFLAFMIIGLVMVKENRGGRVKKFIIRLMFIGLGLPLLGSMYTGVLNKFDSNPVSITGPSKAVASTYVDFGAWMMNDRLHIPDKAEIGWDSTDGKATTEAMMNARNTAMLINAQSVPGYSSLDTDLDFSTDVQDNYEENQTSVGLGSENGAIITATFNLLSKFVSGTKVTASEFEGKVKESVQSLSADVTDGEGESDKRTLWFQGSYSDASKPKEFGVGSASDKNIPVEENPVISIAEGKGLKAEKVVNTIEFNLGWTTISWPSSVTYEFETQEGTTCGSGNMISTDNGGLSSCNLSALSAYNYLNTDFGKDAWTVYSSNKSVSDATRGVYASVSQVGSGPMKFMYWSNTISLLVAVILIGFWYALGILFGTLKRTIQLVAAVPFATVGAMAAIAKVVVYAIAMILEIIATLFVYQFVIEIFVALPAIINSPMLAAMSKMEEWFGSSGSVDTIAFIMTLVATVISTLLIWVMCFMMLKARKSVVKGIDENVTKVIDRFMDTNTAPGGSGGPGMLPSLAQGAGAGAGLAAGNKAMGMLGDKLGGGGSGNSPKFGDGPTNVGGANGDGPNAPKGDGPDNDGKGPSGSSNSSNTPIKGDGDKDGDDKDSSLNGTSGQGGAGGEAGRQGTDGGDDNDADTDGNDDGDDNNDNNDNNSPVTAAGSVQQDKAVAAQLASQGGLSDPKKTANTKKSNLGFSDGGKGTGATSAAAATGTGTGAAKAGAGTTKTGAKGTANTAAKAGLKKGQHGADLVHKMGRNAQGQLVSQGLVRRDSLSGNEQSSAPLANEAEVNMAGGLDQAVAGAGGMKPGERINLPKAGQAARWSTPASQGDASGASTGLAIPAQAGDLPLRSEAVAQMGGAQAVAQVAKAKGMSTEAYMNKHMGPFLDQANPEAAAAVQAAGGSAAYMAQNSNGGPVLGAAKAVPRVADVVAGAGAKAPGQQPQNLKGGAAAPKRASRAGAGASATPMAGQGQAPVRTPGQGQGQVPAPAHAEAGAPVPLNQVPMTSKGNHVARQPGESNLQYLKARAEAEGWRQTPEGWVQNQGAPAAEAASVAGASPAQAARTTPLQGSRPAQGRRGSTPQGSQGSAPVQQPTVAPAVSQVPAPGEVYTAAAQAQAQAQGQAKSQAQAPAQAGTPASAPKVSATSPAPEVQASAPAAAAASQSARSDKSASTIRQAKSQAPKSQAAPAAKQAPVSAPTVKNVTVTVQEISDGVKSAGLNPQAISSNQPVAGKVVPHVVSRKRPYSAAKQTLVNSGWNPAQLDDGMKMHLEQLAADMQLPAGTLPTPAQVQTMGNQGKLSGKNGKKGRRSKDSK